MRRPALDFRDATFSAPLSATYIALVPRKGKGNVCCTTALCAFWPARGADNKPNLRDRQHARSGTRSSRQPLSVSSVTKFPTSWGREGSGRNVHVFQVKEGFEPARVRFLYSSKPTSLVSVGQTASAIRVQTTTKPSRHPSIVPHQADSHPRHIPNGGWPHGSTDGLVEPDSQR